MGRQGHMDYIKRDSRRKSMSVVVTKVLKGESIDDLIRTGYSVWVNQQWEDKDKMSKGSGGSIKVCCDKDIENKGLVMNSS